jgi:hypothetical protein
MRFALGFLMFAAGSALACSCGSGHFGWAAGGESVREVFLARRGASEYATTNKDGSFQLPVLAATAGEIHAEILVFEPEASQCPHFGAVIRPNGWATSLSTPRRTTVAGTGQSSLELVFPFPSCTGWPGR